jgi:cardiolipin synthase
MHAALQLFNRERHTMTDLRALADQAFSRAAGAPLIAGNSVRLLKDARENYPAWLAAIGAAQRHIHFENYILREDEVGHRFADALLAKAREGVRVRLIYDWMGGFGKTSRAFWRHLRAGGVDVRCYNPPRLDAPFGWLSRDHRKMLAVDGHVGFVTGLCVGRMWVGVPEAQIEPWRDTGVEVHGPAVADVVHAFAHVWALLGEPLPAHELVRRDTLAPAGATALRVVACLPATAGLFRLDQLVAYREPGILRSWQQGCASLSGTAPCCTPKRPWPTDTGHASARQISTWRVGSATESACTGRAAPPASCDDQRRRPPSWRQQSNG